MMTSPLIGEIAPDFTCSAVQSDGEIIDDFNLHTHIRDKYALLFFFSSPLIFFCQLSLVVLFSLYRTLNEILLNVGSEETNCISFGPKGFNI